MRFSRPFACFLVSLLVHQAFGDPMTGVSEGTVTIGVPAFLLAPLLAFPLTRTGGKLGCLIALFLLPASWFVGIYVKEVLLGLSGLSGSLAGALAGGLTSFLVLKMIYAYLHSKVEE